MAEQEPKKLSRCGFIRKTFKGVAIASTAAGGGYSGELIYQHFRDKERFAEYRDKVSKGLMDPRDLPLYGQSLTTCGNRCIAMLAAKVLGRYISEKEVYKAARVGLSLSETKAVEEYMAKRVFLFKCIRKTINSIPLLRLGATTSIDNEIAMKRLGMGYECTYNGDLKWLERKLSEGKNPIVEVNGFTIKRPDSKLGRLQWVNHAVIVTKMDEEYVYFNNSGVSGTFGLLTPGMGAKERLKREDFIAAWKPIKRGRYAFCEGDKKNDPKEGLQ